jgi:hypothetical protein
LVCFSSTTSVVVHAEAQYVWVENVAEMVMFARGLIANTRRAEYRTRNMECGPRKAPPKAGLFSFYISVFFS